MKIVSCSNKSKSKLVFLISMAMASMMMGRMMSITPPSSSSSPLATDSLSAPSSSPTTKLQFRTIPGTHGLPLIGPFADRLDYFWFQGPDTFFRSRKEKYNSTVFRTNIPPTFPFFPGGVSGNVIAVVDSKSFAKLFDMEDVEKTDCLIGEYMPSVEFTGGNRVCAYLDTTEAKHAQLKNFAIDILKRGSKVWAKELNDNLRKFFDNIESDIDKQGSSSYISPLQNFLFNFLTKSLIGVDPAVDPDIAKSGPSTLNTWLALQLLPTVPLRVIQPLEEIFLHSYTYPFAFVSKGYRKLYDFVQKYGGEVIRRGEKEFNLPASEAIHNLIFVLGFNAFGGFSVFLPSLIGTIAKDKTGLQARLREEVRKFSKSSKSLSFESVKKMELVNSVVYESLRFNPPVTLQFARARKDFELSSHDSVFNVKEGELLCGYQPLAMRDDKIFDEPESFKPDRFMGEGKELLSYLFWSNGPQTGLPSESNKQCAAKDYVTVSASLILAHFFQRYDSISGDLSKITAVEKAK